MGLIKTYLISKFINSNASQEFFDFTAKNYYICNLPILVIFSMYCNF